MGASLNQRRVVLGITGSIAASKGVELARLLAAAGVELKIVLSEGAKSFVTPLSVQGLTGAPVFDQLWDWRQEAVMGHIQLARWAERVIVAPASAHCLAKLAQGLADDVLSCMVLATEAPVAVAPAMNQFMWRHQATQRNVRQLLADGVTVWGPDTGLQACGETGPGRLLEPAVLLQLAAQWLGPLAWQGRRVLITAGPTREPLDAVRFFGNRSSGKMGYALAQALVEQGAEVCLVSGPVAVTPPRGVRLVRVDTALEMDAAVQSEAPRAALCIAAAAVADFRPETVAADKVKRQGRSDWTVRLVPNPDILAGVAALSPRPFCVGFAAETRDLEQHALDKLRRKGLDMVVANRVDQSDRGFEVDDNAARVFWPGGEREFPLMSKLALARELIALIGERMYVTHHQDQNS